MSAVVLAAESQTPQWLYGSTYAYLRIYASTDFYTSDGISITGGQVGSPNWYQQYTCTVSGTTLTIPQVTLQSTTDSTVEAATYTAVLFDSRGTQRNIKLQNFRVDPSLAPASTWQALAINWMNGTVSSFHSGRRARRSFTLLFPNKTIPPQRPKSTQEKGLHCTRNLRLYT